jgi:hypothetical protein
VGRTHIQTNVWIVCIGYFSIAALKGSAINLKTGMLVCDMGMENASF